MNTYTCSISQYTYTCACKYTRYTISLYNTHTHMTHITTHMYTILVAHRPNSLVALLSANSFFFQIKQHMEHIQLPVKLLDYSFWAHRATSKATRLFLTKWYKQHQCMYVHIHDALTWCNTRIHMYINGVLHVYTCM